MPQIGRKFSWAKSVRTGACAGSWRKAKRVPGLADNPGQPQLSLGFCPGLVFAQEISEYNFAGALLAGNTNGQ